MATPHWHVSLGLAGYGPDASDTDGFPTFEDVTEVADYVRDELSNCVDFLLEGAHASGEAGDFETAWKDYLLSERLEFVRANMSNKRQHAPLYAGKPSAWRDALSLIIEETFPLDVSYNTRLYVWTCDEDDCVLTDCVDCGLPIAEAGFELCDSCQSQRHFEDVSEGRV